MPTASRDFVLGNRMVKKGEDFEIPAGEESDFKGKGLIEGEEGDTAQGQPLTGAETPALAGGAVSPEPGAHESAEETARRAVSGTPEAEAAKAAAKPDGEAQQ